MRRFALAVIVAFLPIRAHAQDEWERHVLELEDVSLHYRTLGEGRPIVGLNGGPGWSGAHMDEVYARLAEHGQVITFDQRGTGASELKSAAAPITIAAMLADLEAVREAVGVDRWVVYGHSFGSIYGTSYAAAHPERIEALILSATTGLDLDMIEYYPASLDYQMTPDGRTQFEYWSQPENSMARPRFAGMKRMQAYITGMVYNRELIPAAQSIVDETTYKEEISNAVFGDLIANNWDLKEALLSFEAPTLILHGRQDALGDHVAYEASDVLPNDRLMIVNEAAHLIFLDQPEIYYGAIAEFLTEN